MRGLSSNKGYEWTLQKWWRESRVKIDIDKKLKFKNIETWSFPPKTASKTL